MVQKPSKGKGVASSNHGLKRPKRTSEEEQDDMTSPEQPLRRYGIHWITEQEEDEMARVDSDIEYSDAEEEDYEMGEAALELTDDEVCRPKEFLHTWFIF
ncbi:hypothetical protein HAX54_014567 [Datura stramonium]|uniref:Uncharacterized protein n=1 Tax=Datura stramonium TaxID=4076 RepID=A0ABS8TNA8_DATST|nr:hypothetical protein [Datura stramonium]